MALLVLTLSLSQTALCAKTKIKSIYFNGDNSIVIEADNAIDFVDYKINSSSLENASYVLEFKDAYLNKKSRRNLHNDSYALSFKQEKHSKGKLKFYSKDNIAKVFVDSKYKDLNFKLRPILENSAYEISFSAGAAKADFTDAFKDQIDDSDITELDQSAIKLDDYAGLGDIEEQVIASPAPKTASEEFLENLGGGLADKISSNQAFQEEKQSKLDAAELEVLGDALAESGHKDEALDAFRKSLELNPENLNANMGLAQNTDDKKEKLANYLKVVKTQALVEIGDSWLEAGVNSNNPKTISAALTSLQYAVLKEPLNPNLRYRYAKALERAGEDNYPKAAKRYLEAAAISKKKLLFGEKQVEPLLRNSLESLIRVLCLQGDFNSANKYCQSYMALGYKKFLKGDPIAAIQKNIKSNKNPFSYSLDI